MEMENSALMHILTTQTQILEEIRDLRQKEASKLSMTPVSISEDSKETNVSSEPDIFDPSEHYVPLGTMSSAIETPMQPVSPVYGSVQGTLVDPTKYGTSIAGKPTNHLIPGQNQIANSANMAIDETISTFRDFDQTKMSKEDMAAFFAQQSRGFQEMAVDAGGKVVEGAGFLGSFAVGGLLAGTAVGIGVGGATAYVAGEMADGAKEALNYQDILRESGYKAFNAMESTMDYGGIGIGLEDSQDISSMLRDLATESYLDDEEMATILQGGLDNKLLKGASDVKSFQKKMKEIVDTTKEVAITLNETLDGAMEFLGEMERRGIAQKDTTFLASQAKVSASMLGMSTEGYTQMMLENTDAIVAGTAMDASDVMQSTNQNAFLSSEIMSNAKENNEALYNYVKNNGGEGAMAGQVEANVRSFFMGEQGQRLTAGLMGTVFETDETGLIGVDQERVTELLSSDKGYKELTDESFQHIGSLAETEQNQIKENAGEIFSTEAKQDDLYRALDMMQKMYQEEAGVEMDRVTALQKMGIATDRYGAEFLSEMIEARSEGEVSDQFYSKALKEEMDASRMAESPSLTKRWKGWWQRNVGNEFGDIGQGISDFVGSESQDIQMMLSGVEERDIVGGALLEEFNIENVEKNWVGENSSAYQIDEFMKENKVFHAEQESLGNNAWSVQGSDIEPVEKQMVQSLTEVDLQNAEMSFSSAEFSRIVDKLDAGELSGGDFSRLRQMAQEGSLDDESQQRVDYVLKKANNEFDGFWGNVKQLGNLAVVNAKGPSDSLEDLWGGSGVEQLTMDGKEVDSKEDIELIEKELKKDFQGLQEEFESIWSSQDVGVGVEESDRLEKMVRAGLVEEVKGMTSNEDVIGLAQKYESALGSQQEYSELSQNYQDKIRLAEGIAKTGESVYDFLATVGNGGEKLFTKDELDSIAGAYKEKGRNFEENMAGMDDQEMYNAQIDMLASGKDLFANMTQMEIEEIVEFSMDKNPNLSREELYIDGTETIDRDKVFENLLEVTRQQQTSESNQDSETSDSDKNLNETAQTHKDAVLAMISTFEEETEALRAATEGARTTNYDSNRTGIGGFFK